MTSSPASVLQKAADNIRILSAAMPEKAVSGHPGGAMGGADYMAVLFSDYLRFDPDDMGWSNRDRFFLDPGHMSPMLYSTLALFGKYSLDELKSFRQWGSPTPGHPELEVHRGVENTSGPLGQGHAFALGAAIAERFLAARFGEWMAHKTFAYISDGGVQEEISQGVGRLAGHLGLSNYVLFYDSNEIQLSHKTQEVTSEDTARKYEAWGWKVETIEGNDQAQIRAALDRAVAEKEKPTLIIGRTIMGKGAVKEDGGSYERQVKTHGMPLSKGGASFPKTVENLGGDPGNPFQIFPEVAEHFSKVKAEKVKAARGARSKQAEWEKANPELAARLKQFLSGHIPQIDWAQIGHKANISTRAASKEILALLAQKVGNMVVSSADLSDSDYTEGFLKNSKAFRKGDFSGAFLQAGVSELTMASVCVGMSLHGGVLPACGTFFAFSDYQKPTLRLAALMEQPVVFIWTHDAFRVGEDGPTHQPIEQEAQVRLLEKMNNLSGHRSLLALRPADAHETTEAWKLALENRSTPTALILSRQDIPDLPAKSGSTRIMDAMEAKAGAYVVNPQEGRPDLILLANGSEVALLVKAAEQLAEARKLKVRVVSAISEGLFREQRAEYQEQVLPFGVPVLGWTAGLPANLAGLVGPLGKVYGMTRFGASAPFKVLDEKFGFTVENVVVVAESYLAEHRAMVKRFKEAV